MKIFAVINPASGSGKGKKRWKSLQRRLEKRLGLVEFQYTQARGHAMTLTAAALRRGCDVILVVGGDGTINEVANGFFDQKQLINPEAMLGIFPAGTGSDLVKTLQLPERSGEQISLIEQKRFQAVDVGFAEYTAHNGNRQNCYFLNLASAGIGGEVCAKINGMQSKLFHGTLAYFKASLEVLFRFKPKNLRIVIDHHTPISKTCSQVAVCNGRFYGGGMKLAPGAKIDDGFFDVVIIGKMSIVDFLKYVPKLYGGGVHKFKKVHYQKARRVAIDSADHVLIDIDGESPGRVPVVYEIFPAALKIIK